VASGLANLGGKGDAAADAAARVRLDEEAELQDGGD